METSEMVQYLGVAKMSIDTAKTLQNAYAKMIHNRGWFRRQINRITRKPVEYEGPQAIVVKEELVFDTTAKRLTIVLYLFNYSPFEARIDAEKSELFFEVNGDRRLEAQMERAVNLTPFLSSNWISLARFEFGPSKDGFEHAEETITEIILRGRLSTTVGKRTGWVDVQVQRLTRIAL